MNPSVQAWFANAVTFAASYAASAGVTEVLKYTSCVCGCVQGTLRTVVTRPVVRSSWSMQEPAASANTDTLVAAPVTAVGPVAAVTVLTGGLVVATDAVEVLAANVVDGAAVVEVAGAVVVETSATDVRGVIGARDRPSPPPLRAISTMATSATTPTAMASTLGRDAGVARARAARCAARSSATASQSMPPPVVARISSRGLATGRVRAESAYASMWNAARISASVCAARPRVSATAARCTRSFSVLVSAAVTGWVTRARTSGWRCAGYQFPSLASHQPGPGDESVMMRATCRGRGVSAVPAHASTKNAPMSKSSVLRTCRATAPRMVARVPAKARWFKVAASVAARASASSTTASGATMVSR